MGGGRDSVGSLRRFHCPARVVLQWVLLPLPATFIADTLVSRFHVLAFSASPAVLWYEAINADNSTVPVRGLGVPGAPLSSDENATTFKIDTTWPSIRLLGRRLACSPTPTPTQTPSQTASSSPSPSQAQTPSTTPTGTATPSESTSQTATRVRRPPRRNRAPPRVRGLRR